MTPLRYVDVAYKRNVPGDGGSDKGRNKILRPQIIGLSRLEQLSLAKNVQTRPENGSLAKTGEFGSDKSSSEDIFITPSQEDDDLGIIDTDPAYYDEEPVDAHSAEEREDNTESGSPEVYAEMQADLLHDNTWNDLQYATEKFVQQYLVGIHSCSAREHRQSLAAHIEDEGTSNHHGIAKLFPRNVPRTLDKQDFLKSQTYSETPSLGPPQW